METGLSYLISSSTVKSPPWHAHAGSPLLEHRAGICSLSPHPLPFAILCKSSKQFYAFLLPLSGPKKCAWVEAAAPFPCSFLTSASCSLLPTIMWSSRSAGISFPGNAAGSAVLPSPLLGGLGNSSLQPCNLGRESSHVGNRSRQPWSRFLRRQVGRGLSPPQRGIGRSEDGGGVWGAFPARVARCWAEETGTQGPRSRGLAASRFGAFKASGLGCAWGAWWSSQVEPGF